MDVLAHWRQAQGLPGLSINWGAWGQIGAAVEQQVIGRLASKGIQSFSPEQGMEVFEALLQSHDPQVGVVSLDWSRYLQGRAGTTYLEDFTQLPESEQRPKQVLESVSQSLTEIPLDQQRDYLISYVRSAVTKVLGLRTTEKLELNRRLIDLGMDSLTSVELRNRVRTDLRVDISIDQLMSNPSLGELVDRIMEQSLLSEARATDADKSVPESPSTQTSGARKRLKL
ncbi:MAG: hypothetical protein HC921_11195 [Synechococcaceae cyanobacterium SM2_3_1]|nr:hypothetical protein [Synechococcaceae cyanobacterium SM2_3_1]